MFWSAEALRSLFSWPFHGSNPRHEIGWFGGEPANKVRDLRMLPQGFQLIPGRAQFPFREYGVNKFMAGGTQPRNAAHHLLPGEAAAGVAFIMLAARNQVMFGDELGVAKAQLAPGLRRRDAITRLHWSTGRL